MSDVVLPEQIERLVSAELLLRDQLIESIRPALLVSQGSVAAQAEAAMAAVHRAIRLPAALPAVAALAGVVLAPELQRSLAATPLPLPARARPALLTDLARGPVARIESLLVDEFRLVLGSDPDGPTQLLAEMLADVALQVIRSERGRASVAYLCGLRSAELFGLGGAA